MTSGKRSPPFVVLDRDGTLIEERHYLSDPGQVALLPGAAEAMRQMKEKGLGIIVVSNQSAVGRGFIDEMRLGEIHERLVTLLAGEGVTLDGIFYCPHVPEDNCRCRKPKDGLIRQAAEQLGLDPARSFVIGDKKCDIDLGIAVGAVPLLVRTGYGKRTEEELGSAYPGLIVVNDLMEASEYMAKSSMVLEEHR
ncbi:MAG: HAD family hydrolase [Candidatus Eremiobacteraeota bacterium]|nr:HAD family hydrolase [Candidatus Eremiobacteraeota bacterium]